MRITRSDDDGVSTDTIDDMPKPATDPELPPLVSLTGAGLILGVKRAQAHRLYADGKLPGGQVDTSGALVFRRAVIEEIAAKRRGE